MPQYQLLPAVIREREPVQTIEVVDGVTYHVPPWEDTFLLALSRVGTVRQACALSNISRSTYYTHFQYSPPFRKRCLYAKEDAKDILFEEAHRRAVEGTERPVFFQGQQVGTTREYSDQLMVLLIKGTHSEMFTHKVDVTTDGQPVVRPAVFLPQVETIDAEVVEDK